MKTASAASREVGCEWWQRQRPAQRIFNSGARSHLASFANSDVTLTELDDPVNPNADAFFAGWSNEAALPTDTLIAIHHPGVDEKRISFSFQSGASGKFRKRPIRSPTATCWSSLLGHRYHRRGLFRDHRSFDKNKRVRGQLFGGLAACTVTRLYDVYGYFRRQLGRGRQRRNAAARLAGPLRNGDDVHGRPQPVGPQHHRHDGRTTA
jgi:hypothetical protein